jgi:hypothetical protein
MYLGGTYKRRITWGEVPGIYKARFRELWQVLRLSLLAAAIAFATVVLIPLMLGAALFSGHVILMVIVVLVALLVSAWLFWKSLKLAFTPKGRG